MSTSILAVLLAAALLEPSAAVAADLTTPPKLDTSQSLDDVSGSDLRILRNTVFAIHGYQFESEDLRAYFWDKPWYQKVRREMERAGRRFDPQSLSQAEKAFVARIEAREEALAASSPAGPGRLYAYSAIANKKQFPAFSAPVKAMIEKNGFVVLPSHEKQFFELYEANDYLFAPSFVTSDAVLQLFHVYFDFALRETERSSLLPLASKLSETMQRRALSLWTTSPDGATRDAAALVARYFAVASALFSGGAPQLPAALLDAAAKEVALARAHKAPAGSPVLGGKIDYTSFTPRGHYTRSKTLTHYFQGMSWLIQGAFELGQPADLRAMVLMAELMRTPTGEGASSLQDVWSSLDESMTFFVGSADDLTLGDVFGATEAAYGKGPFDPAALSDDTRLAKVASRLSSADHAKIRPPGEGPKVTLMGARYIPDTEILQQLVEYPRRPLPKGLDIFAVLGNPEAAALLDTHYHEPARWDDYGPKREALQKRFASLPASAWSANLYWGWLDALRGLTAPSPSEAPPFAHTKAWRLKELQAGLASWAELRRDTILYSKQFAAECGGEEEEQERPPMPKGYVEPVPVLYARLRTLVVQAGEGLEQRHLMPEKLKSMSQELVNMLRFLENVSNEELAGKALSGREYDQIRSFGSNSGWMSIRMLTDFSGGDVLEGPDRRVSVVADVGRSSQTYLEEAIGNVDQIFVVVKIDGKPVLTRGGVFSYYEFPSKKRLSDEEWQKRLDEAPPPRPDWIESFLHPTPAPKMPVIYLYSSGC